MSNRNRRTLVSKIKCKARKKIKSFLWNKKAASVALTTVILTAGVLAMSIAVLYWAFSWGNLANRQYSKAIATSSSAIEERIGFEYISYSGSSNVLTVNIINWGTSNDVSIIRVYLKDNQQNPIGLSYTPSPLRAINSGALISSNSLNPQDEGYFTLSPSVGLSSGFYNIRIVTERGRSFDGTFVVP
jgi:hypothetical protein